MVIDDTEVDQLMCRRVLARSKMATDMIEFTCAEAALAYLADPSEPPVDLILLDINMPRMTGFEFLDAADRILGAGCLPTVMILLGGPLTGADSRRAAGFAQIKGHCNKPLAAQHLHMAAGLLRAS